ncbi:MAG: hypothetical protein R3208_15200 [Ketobacteraceae bacterium]|nr:hypothetical protein [Ketobacteraceae bacterium]
MGVELPGAQNDNAIASTVRLAPTAASAEHIQGTLLLNRIVAVIHPEATVALVNRTLEENNARIVSMRENDPYVVLVVEPVNDLVEARALAENFTDSSAFLYARPGFTHPVTNDASAAPAILATHHSRTNISPGNLPDQEALGRLGHLLPARVPAAWNVRDVASHRSKLLIPGYFVDNPQYAEIAQLNFAASGGRALTASDGPAYNLGNRGYAMAGLAAANWEYHESGSPHTGVDPVAESLLDVTGVYTYGLDESEIITALGDALVNQNEADNIVLLGVQTYDDPAASNFRYIDRAWMALRWRRAFYDSVSNADFLNTNVLAVVSGGRLPPVGAQGDSDARLNSFFAVAANEDLITVASRDGNPGQIAAFQTALENHVDEQPLVSEPLNNIIIAGSSDDTGNQTQNSMDGSYVRMVGKDVLAPCVVPNFCTEASIPLSGPHVAAAQVAGLASYLWHLDNSLSVEDLISRLQHAYFASKLPGVLDAWVAVLSLDSELNNAPLRRTLLDVSGPEDQPDGHFDERDVAAFVSAFEAFENAIEPTWSVYDLNGDGWTGGNHTASMDLDIDMLPDFSTVEQMVAGESMTFDENALTDSEVLCYYAWSPLYTGEETARNQIPDCNGELVVELTLMQITLATYAMHGERDSSGTILNIPDGSEARASEANTSVPILGVSSLSEAAAGTIEWHTDFNETNISLERFHFDFSALATASFTPPQAEYLARSYVNGSFFFRFTINATTNISFIGSVGGENTDTYIKLWDRDIIFFEMEGDLAEIPIDYSRDLPPGSYEIVFNSFVYADYYPPESELDSGNGELVLTVLFNAPD